MSLEPTHYVPYSVSKHWRWWSGCLVPTILVPLPSVRTVLSSSINPTKAHMRQHPIKHNGNDNRHYHHRDLLRNRIFP